MKKIVGLFSVCALIALGCTKSSTNEELKNDELVAEVPVAAHRGCVSHQVLEAQLKADPSLAGRMQAIEQFTARFQQNPSAYRILANGNIELPVVVNVVYRTTAENISDAQIASQIAVLNADYSATNPDNANVPSVFQSVKAGNTGITFVLDKVIRFRTKKTSFSYLTDGVKKASGGGIAPTSPTTKLNMWTCNLSGGVLGYAQFPGAGPSSTDGVVMRYNAFGVTTAGAPYNKGRTATHEVGHWLNLKHIWGDDIETPTNNPANDCLGDDEVADTPNQGAMNYGSPTFPRVSCNNSAGGGDMFMNYMDYTDDLAMFMFTAGQKTRMLATFANGGPRNSFAQP
jgi:hypothetical protein